MNVCYEGLENPLYPGKSICDLSDNYFTISSSTTGKGITLLTPNGGEKWMLNSLHLITWTPEPDSDQMEACLEKYIDGNYITVGKARKNAKGSIEWIGEIESSINCPKDSGLVAYPDAGDNYFLRIDKVVNGKVVVSDRSDKPFTLLPFDFMKVDLKINGSDGPIEVSESGTSVRATWTSDNASSCELYDGTNTISGLSVWGSRNLILKNSQENYSVFVNCSSSYGQRNDYIDIIPVNSSLPPLDVTIKTVPATATVGQTLNFGSVLTAGSGGTPPINYLWQVNGVTKPSNTDMMSYTFDKVGDFTIRLFVSDSVGKTDNAVKKVTVVSSTSTALMSNGDTQTSAVLMGIGKFVDTLLSLMGN